MPGHQLDQWTCGNSTENQYWRFEVNDDGSLIQMWSAPVNPSQRVCVTESIYDCLPTFPN